VIGFPLKKDYSWHLLEDDKAKLCSGPFGSVRITAIGFSTRGERLRIPDKEGGLSVDGKSLRGNIRSKGKSD
jgi:hypothetical protein